MNGEYTQKIDILELLINCIKETEEKLDGLVARLEEASRMIPVSGRLKKTGNSISLTIPKDIATHHLLETGTHIYGYIKKTEKTHNDREDDKTDEQEDY